VTQDWQHEESIEEGLERIRRQTGSGAAPTPASGPTGITRDVRTPVPRGESVLTPGVPGPRPGDDLLPSYSSVIAWTRLFAAIVAAFFATSVSRWFGFGLFSIAVLALAAVVVVRSILRVIAAPQERAWCSSAGVHIVERRTEQVIAWPALVRAESVVPRGQSKTAKVVLHLDDGSRVAPRQWNGIGVPMADQVVSRILECQQRTAGRRSP
jgi:hypothetical protein